MNKLRNAFGNLFERTSDRRTSTFQPNYGNYYLSSPLYGIEPNYDVVVIGSGYGGSISASRAARAGKKVYVLEKGQEWRPGHFPETALSYAEETQMTVHDGTIIGNHTNLFDVVISPDVIIVQGCGLGGTSLINAAVALEVDPRVFQDEIWPKAFREDLETFNGVDKKRAMDMLQPSAYPEHFPQLTKMTRMKTVAEHIADIESLDVSTIFKRPPLLVNFEDTQKNCAGVPQPACISCGNCCCGCNTGAKKTLDMNYIPDAKAHGAEFFTQVEVRAIVKDPVSDDWLIHFVPHLYKKEIFKMEEQIVRAKVVIVGAGSLGSTDLLMKSQARGLELSSKLGKGFSPNQDTIGFSYNGELPTRALAKSVAKTKEKPKEAPGPSVTTLVDLREVKGEDLSKDTVLLDFTPPASANLAYGIVMKVEDVVSGVDESGNKLQEIGRELTGKDMQHNISFFGVGQDPGDGELKRDDKTDYVWVDYPKIGDDKNWDRIKEEMEEATKALKGTFIPNPYWEGLTAKLRHSKGATIAHPLGGCRMGESGANGVVNHAGQVFVGDTSDVHQGLYVLDGSIVPRSLSIHPLLTISKITERGMRLMAEERGWTIDYESSKVIDFDSMKSTPGIRFAERMEGEMNIGDNSGQCDIILNIESQDVARMINRDKSHRLGLSGSATCELMSSSPLTVSKGVLNLLAESKDHVPDHEIAYTFNLTSAEGKVYFLTGTQLVHKDSLFDFGINETTHLVLAVHEGDSKEGEEIGKATLHINAGDISKKIGSIEVTRASNKMEKIKWKTKFLTFYMGHMLRIFGPFTCGNTYFDPGAPPRERRILKLNEGHTYPIQTEDDTELLLTRYEGGSKGPVMLVPGLGVSTMIYTVDTIDTNLAEFLFAAGYDVWLFDWRASTLLPSATEETDIDICANQDIPAAVKKVLSVTEKKDLQIFTHCAGAVITSASILGGHLQGLVRSLTISQSGFITVPSTVNWFKSHSHLPQILYGIGVKGITAYTDSHQNWMGKVLDLFFEGEADVTTTFKEHCDNPVCHRITFLYGFLYEHEKLNASTHNTMHEQFGYADAKLLKHFALCFENGHVVDYKGKNVYLPDLKKGLQSQAYKEKMALLDIPIQFCSGEKNQAYDPKSTKKGFEMVKEAHPDQDYDRFVVKDYGHIDCIMGKDASSDVFPKFLRFLDRHAEE